jgi:O-antigen/teichoic acid export membrane protein
MDSREKSETSAALLRSRASALLASYGIRGIFLILVPIANFLSVSIIGRFLPVAAFGLFSLVFAVNGGITAILTQPLAEGIARFHNDAIREDRHDYLLRTAAVFVTGLAALITSAYAVALLLEHSVPRLGGTGIPVAVQWAALPYFLFYMVFSIISTYLNIKQAFTLYLVVAAGTPLLATVIVAVAGLAKHATAELAIAAQAIAIAAFLIPFFLTRFQRAVAMGRAIIRAPLSAEKDFMAGFWRYGAPQLLAAVATYVSLFGDRFVVVNYFNLADVGRYSYLFTLTMSIFVALGNAYAGATYYRALEAHAHAEPGRDKHRVLMHFFLMSVMVPILFLPLLILYQLADRNFVMLVFGAHASVPAGCLPIMAISAALFAGAQQLSLVANLLKRQSVLVIPRWTMGFALIGGMVLFHGSIKEICLVAAIVNALNFMVVLGLVAWLAKGSNPVPGQ